MSFEKIINVKVLADLKYFLDRGTRDVTTTFFRIIILLQKVQLFFSQSVQCSVSDVLSKKKQEGWAEGGVCHKKKVFTTVVSRCEM